MGRPAASCHHFVIQTETQRLCPGEWCNWVIAKPLASAPSKVL